MTSDLKRVSKKKNESEKTTCFISKLNVTSNEIKKKKVRGEERGNKF